VTMTPSFDGTNYKLGAVNMGPFPVSCVSTTITLDIQTDALTYSGQTAECVATLTSDTTQYPLTYHFLTASASCNWLPSGPTMHLNDFNVIDIARLNLALSG
jgi:hypothetical protein